MMKALKIVVLAAGLLPLIHGCATPISAERLANADYGPPPPANYKEQVENRIKRNLLDPTSPLFEMGEPSKGYTRESPMFNTSEMFGWKVCGTVNAKNRFGGYVGRVPFFALFRHDNLMYVMTGEADEPYSMKNAAINSACSR